MEGNEILHQAIITCSHPISRSNVNLNTICMKGRKFCATLIKHGFVLNYKSLDFCISHVIIQCLCTRKFCAKFIKYSFVLNCNSLKFCISYVISNDIVAYRPVARQRPPNQTRQRPLLGSVTCGKWKHCWRRCFRCDLLSNN
jgi:hypothetical protein